MTTPNIKALAEKIVEGHKTGRIVVEKADLMGESWNYQLASALLRVMEDAENLKSELEDLIDAVEVVSPGSVDPRITSETIAAHNKLMEELGGE